MSSAIYAQSQWCGLCILLGHTVISYFLSTKVLFFCFLLAVVVSSSEDTCIEMFFNKFESNIEKFEAKGNSNEGAQNILILRETILR